MDLSPSRQTAARQLSSSACGIEASTSIAFCSAGWRRGGARSDGKQIDWLDKGFFVSEWPLPRQAHLHLDVTAAVCACLCVFILINRSKHCVCVCEKEMKSRQPDGHLGNRKPFIYLYDLIKWHLWRLLLSECVAGHCTRPPAI